ncbi:MAG: hypothetical protein J7483_10970 [Novosphingobium sp.]|nr:hypothetical protein [Novosphingobium sp.]
MSAFEFAFTLFGLVLGLAMAEVLAGFVRVLKARSKAPGESAKIRIGWLTPAIGAIVLLDLITSWLLAWKARELIPITMLTLSGGTLATALYFVAASLVWPDEPAEWPDLDAWFDRHKGQIGGAIVAANVGFSACAVLTGAGTVPVLQVIYIASAAALIVTRRRWQSAIVVVALLLNLAEAFSSDVLALL